ncbi:NADH dehydrogenase [ubiquinone] 1 alpha subcomplex subunit 1 [Aspergillus melleus]|uniref:NADH dehydrogenase [ubiquinone] 1 alpha subcomplex subunit 1 n=1 Tax=Aspergillus melleus TaxID=138277 RepID=UPI001E8D0C43|nr:uncharacterized protein LDX57_006012 [Aspergillus melleus]KAH8428311.1 hypothetical protein LDX57_006012 [Aspergillus melleus]
MGVPFEALLPYGIIIGFMGVTGAGLTAVKYWSNEGKTARWNRDLWDRQMMERDLRLTGTMRGQSSNEVAPKGFELSNPWKLEKRIY